MAIEFNSQPKLSMCSFFSGGGLFDYGFKNHFNILWANELSSKAALAYRANIGDHMHVGDIEDFSLDDIPYADVYVGTPPCQDFSSDGVNRGEDGERGRLVWVYLEIIRAKRPKAFVMENVIGLARKHKETLARLVQEFEGVGYRVTQQVVDCADYGVPQHRQRVFLVGMRNDLACEFEFPAPSMRRVTIRDAIGDLQNPDEALVNDLKLGTVPNHLVTWTSPTPERLADVMKNPRPNQRRGMRRFEWDRVGFTITHHIGKDGREFLHPDANRRISVREALRIMAVPDSYVIPPEIRIRDQYFIVGNGVPTLMGSVISASLAQQLGQVVMARKVG